MSVLGRASVQCFIYIKGFGVVQYLLVEIQAKSPIACMDWCSCFGVTAINFMLILLSVLLFNYQEG